ncbi:MAG TPA: hypothetical protein VM056_01455 [Terriglobales bacterium]|nr:hypothetical protein [Terriglobales bacterium]
MAKKKKLKKFRAVTAVKAMAREVVGQPPATRRDPDTKKKSETKSTKHKKPLNILLAEQE